MQEDRRMTQRKFIMYYSRIFDAGTENLVGHLGDISIGGLMMISDEPLVVDWIYRLKLELDDDISPEPFLILTARSRWCQPDVTPQSYNTGFALEDVSPEAQEIIQRIVDKYAFKAR